MYKVLQEMYHYCAKVLQNVYHLRKEVASLKLNESERGINYKKRKMSLEILITLKWKCLKRDFTTDGKVFKRG